MAKAFRLKKKFGWFKKHPPTSARGQLLLAPKRRYSEFLCVTMVNEKGDRKNIGIPGKVVKLGLREYIVAESGSLERIV